MLTVFAALVPVFLLIVLGYALRRLLLKQNIEWVGLEQLVYYVLFPALLIDTLARANLSSVPIAGVGGALLLSVILMSALCLALRPLLARAIGLDGPAFTSLFQGATRWQTFVALSVAGNLWGDLGITLASVAMVAMIPLLNILAVWVLAHYASPQRMAWPALLLTIARNPLIWACVIGLAINLAGLPVPRPAHEFLDALGRCSLAMGLLIVGAGLQLEGLHRPGMAAALTVVLKLAVMPLIAMGLGIAFGLSGANLAVVVCCASVPSASNGYILARQMGGDAPLLAQILTIQTTLAVLTMPVFIALAE
ncbi:AEC family transporter [Tardiphaga sp. 42S5]|uniref:AEC family transporter n=1 Tax=Tardiphaga sp. 42S5 TaxID=1404799 RepID=UPI002A5AD242|nr:AEC family transporter [Tardiphaga sp. 42S5]WPO40095.1 AEC family transporter [Tardiphaga sp. 42S5]